MKKYKLIKEYPDSPKLGFTVKFKTGYPFVSPAEIEAGIKCNLSLEECQNYPEFWEEVVEDTNPLKLELGKIYKIRYKLCTSPIEICKVDEFTRHGHPWSKSLGIITDSYELIEEVVEKDYEILSFKTPNNTSLMVGKTSQGWFTGVKEVGNNDFRSKEWLIKHNYLIESIRRLSDGEVFTIGDKVGWAHNFIITSFSLKNNYCYANGININILSVIKKPLFTTEDGVDIYEGDTYFWINNNWEIAINKSDIKNSTYIVFKRFSTKEAAEEYILMNKPCLSINDVMNVAYNPVESRTSSSNKLKKIVKSKL